MVIGVVKLEMQLFAKTKWSHDRWIKCFDVCGQLTLSHTLIKLVAIILAKVGIKLFLISSNRMINESRDQVGKIPSP